MRIFEPPTAIQRVHFGDDEVALVFTTRAGRAPAKKINLPNDSVAPVLGFYLFKGRRRGSSPDIQERTGEADVGRWLANNATPSGPGHPRVSPE